MTRAIAVALALSVGLTACSGPPSDEQVLDGANPDTGEVAGLARERARLGARFLTTLVKDDGTFYYRYYPITDRYEDVEYNIVRHAGTTFSLWQAVSMFGERKMRETADSVTAAIERNTADLPGGKGLVHENEVSLGAQALAIVALLERRRATDDRSMDDLLAKMTAFMLAMERPQRNGRYYQKFNARTRKPVEGPDSIYYPGEALLALTRMAATFDRDTYLPHAIRLADYLTKVRDGDIAATRKIPRQDHWLVIALNELLRMHDDASYEQVAYLQADDMVGNQIKRSRFPERIGAQESRTFNYTSIATKGEALVAAWALAKSRKNEAAETTYREAATRTAQFQMRAQYTTSNAQLFPRPRVIIGAWGESRARTVVRIDFVQHNISALMGLWWIQNDGDVPTAVAS